MKYCKECGVVVADTYEHCPNCGALLGKDNKIIRNKRVSIFAILCIMLLAMLCTIIILLR